MGQIIGYLIGKFGYDFLKKLVIWAYMFTYYGLLITMWASFFAGFFYFYDLLQTFLNNITGSGVAVDSVMSKVYGIMNCIGLTSAFNDSKLIIISGLSFLVSRIAYASILGFYQKILTMIYKA